MIVARLDSEDVLDGWVIGVPGSNPRQKNEEQDSAMYKEKESCYDASLQGTHYYTEVAGAG